MRQIKRNSFRELKSGLLLFLTLACWSLSNPPGSTPDEWFQLGSIWCVDGVDDANCRSITEAGVLSEYQMGETNIDYSSCLFPIKSDVRTCAEAEFEFQPMNSGGYPTTIYRIFNWFVPIGTSLSILFMRLFSALLATSLFVVQMLTMDKKNRLPWLTGFTFTMLPMSIFLLSSLHPSGWAITGVTHGWMFLLTGLSKKTRSRSHRSIPFLLWGFCGCICLASRYDVFLFFAAVSAITGITFVVSNRLVTIKNLPRILTAAAGSIIMIFALSPVARTAISFPNRNLPNQPGTLQWISHWVLNAIAVPVETLGTGLIGTNVTNNPVFQLRIGTVEQPIIPAAVWIVGVALLGGVFLFGLIRLNILQAAALLMSSTLLIWIILGISSRLERDLFNLSGRYIIPLIPFIVGHFIYLSKSPIQLMEIQSLRRVSIVLLSVTHFLALHSVVETYASTQSFGLLPIFLERSGWWWVGLPFGPNFIVLFGSICFTKFLITAWSDSPTRSITGELSGVND